LPAEQRVFTELPQLKTVPDTESDTKNVDDDDEDEKVFKFPYLKNEYNDRHFDLTDPNQLVGKSLLWFANHLSLTDDEELSSMRLIGSIFYGDYDSSKRILQTANVSSAALAVCHSRLEQLTSSTDADGQQENSLPPSEEIEHIKQAVPSSEYSVFSTFNLARRVPEVHTYYSTFFGGFSVCVRFHSICIFQETIDKKEKKDVKIKLSDRIIEHFKEVQTSEEEKLMEKQRLEFRSWKEERANLVQAQVEQVDLRLRLKELSEERQKLRDRWEMLCFFENRLKWEDMANVKDELLSGERGRIKSKEELEQEYVDQVFLKRNAQKS
uniref:SCD domain-containing protein n=1 Tax=Gongylonema pulchrum TaxID=637853 RepID=A0A183D3I0_9BILA